MFFHSFPSNIAAHCRDAYGHITSIVCPSDIILLTTDTHCAHPTLPTLSCPFASNANKMTGRGQQKRLSGQQQAAARKERKRAYRETSGM